MKKSMILCLFGTISLLSAAEIRYEKGADGAVKFAVKDMARCLTQVSGKTYKAVNSLSAPQAGDIIVTNDPKLEKQQWQFAFRDGKMYISGRGAPGMVYGIYTFLEKYAGCAWLAPDVEVIPKNNNWKLPEVNEKGKPAIARREFYVASPGPDWNWRLRNKENWLVSNGLNMWIGSPKDCHTYDVYVKAIKDPKLFGPAANGDKCQTLCMTNPQVRKIILAELMKYIEADRKKFKNRPVHSIPRTYDLSQTDGPSGPECMCPTCKALTEKEGSYAGPNIDFVNWLAREVKKKYPDVTLQTFAYSYTQKPPKTIRTEDNVMIRYCGATLYNPLVAGSKNGKELETWNKFAARKSIWSYWRVFKGSLYPFVKPRKDIAAELRFCAKNGVEHYFGENEDMVGRSFSVQQHYLGLKMLDDPFQDIEKLNDRFMKGYYGAAAPYMQKYLEYLEKHQEDTRAFLDKKFFTKVNDWLDSAEKAVKDDARSLLHVRNERVIVDRTMFFRLDELVKQGYKADFKAICKRFLDNGLAQIKLCTVLNPEMRPRMEEKHRGEADLFSHFPVAIPAQFDGCDVIDMHWNLILGPAYVTKDADAVCGVAVSDPKCVQTLPFRMGFYHCLKRTGCGLEFMKEDIPQDEKFHLYKIGNGHISNGAYIYFDKTWHLQTTLPTIGALGEDRDIWVSIKFQGKPWVANSTKPGKVLFDRIFLVKDPNPLRKYKPVDPSKNMLKNGGFENYTATSIPGWGKNGPKGGIDTKVKHSGKASYRAGDLATSCVYADAWLGKIANLKNDLLIRGWVRQENVNTKGSLLFIGLWPLMDPSSRDTSYRVPVIEFYNGTYEWRYFEKVIDINEFKAKNAKSKPGPGGKLLFRIFPYHQSGTIWVDDLEVIPLEKK